MAGQPYRVLIAHQSTIPHYRVRFYELLNELKPGNWTFDVVFDTEESQNPRIYKEPVDYTKFTFNILDAQTRLIEVRGHKLVWQSFFRNAAQYDIIITDTHITNLTYPAVALYRLIGKKWILWGHTRDMNEGQRSRIKLLAEKAKNLLIRSSNAFFAYTESGKRDLVACGYDPTRITVLNNTIDTRAEREMFVAVHKRREVLRTEFRVSGMKVLIYVGRLMKGKRIPFLLESFALLHKSDPNWHLFVVGTGDEETLVREHVNKLGPQAITFFGAVTDRFHLAPLFIASDLYIIPGYVGLAPLQALCYDLPVIYFDLPTHSPEVEYLNESNSHKLPGNLTPAGLSSQLPQIWNQFESRSMRDQLYPSIEHLTIEAMASHFVAGINKVCASLKPRQKVDPGSYLE